MAWALIALWSEMYLLWLHRGWSLPSMPLTATPAKFTHHKKKETVEDCKTRKANGGHLKVFQDQYSECLGRSRQWAVWELSVSIVSMVINCVDETGSSGSPMLVPVYNAKGKVVAMLQVQENCPSPPISADILKGKVGRCSGIQKNLQAVLEDSNADDYLGEVTKGLMKRLVTSQRKGHPQMMKDKNSSSLTPNFDG